MVKHSSWFVWILSIFFMSSFLAYSQNASSYIQPVKAKKKDRIKRTPAYQPPPPQPSAPSYPSVANLPEPYKNIQILPFNPQGWYHNSRQIETLFKQRKINVVIEVGCWLGLSTRHIASLLPSHGKLYAIDHWQGSVEHQGRPELSTLYQQFLSNVIHAGLTHVIVPMKMDSLKAAARIKSMRVVPDLIYIDASHDTNSVLADLNAWFPLVKGHGVICGDDWTWGGVRAAVETFARQNRLTIVPSDNFWRLVE